MTTNTYRRQWKHVTKLERCEQIFGNMETHEYFRGRNVSNVYDMESWHPIISQSMDFVFVVWTHSKQLSVSKFRVSKWLQVTHLVPFNLLYMWVCSAALLRYPSISPSYPHYGWLYTPHPIKPGYTSHWPMVCPNSLLVL